MNILKELTEQGIPHFITANSSGFGGWSANKREYFVILYRSDVYGMGLSVKELKKFSEILRTKAIKDQDVFLKPIGKSKSGETIPPRRFHKYSDLEEKQLSDLDIEYFTSQILNNYICSSDENGFIYDLKENSFKKYYDSIRVDKPERVLRGLSQSQKDDNIKQPEDE